MRRQLLWTRLDAHGLDHCRVSSNAARGGGTRVQGTVVTRFDGHPATVAYEIRADREWRTRALDVTVHGQQTGRLSLVTDDPGEWEVEAGQAGTDVAGPVDVDLAATPFTNTLPIRRLDLGVGEAADVPVVYVSAPDLTVSVADQRYTRLGPAGDGERYRYENATSGFEAEITVDAEGFVVSYPGLYDRVASVGDDVA
ncbi:MAG: putative glycolipid-binding domain-containing protein [Haloferacaceae archaeon]